MYNAYGNSFMPTAPPAQSGPNWVQGIEGVKSYPVANGSVVVLFDSNDSVFYFKEMDLSGMPRIRQFKYEEIHDKSNPEYVTKDDFDKAVSELKDLFSESKGDK